VTRAGAGRSATARVVVTSAGLLLWRVRGGVREVLLGHPGGPFYARKDDGCWSVPKGEHPPEEPPLVAARREFLEELGLPAPDGDPVPLGEVVVRGGKVVRVWALEADLDLAGFDPGTFTMDWPPRSGRPQAFPEIDRVAWLDLPTAAVKLTASQRPFLDRLPA
jgi:predicted NUDIX family NTP pyrophosphohydrolase